MRYAPAKLLWNKHILVSSRIGQPLTSEGGPSSPWQVAESPKEVVDKHVYTCMSSVYDVHATYISCMFVRTQADTLAVQHDTRLARGESGLFHRRFSHDSTARVEKPNPAAAKRYPHAAAAAAAAAAAQGPYIGQTVFVERLKEERLLHREPCGRAARRDQLHRLHVAHAACGGRFPKAHPINAESRVTLHQTRRQVRVKLVHFGGKHGRGQEPESVHDAQYGRRVQAHKRRAYGQIPSEAPEKEHTPSEVLAAHSHSAPNTAHILDSLRHLAQLSTSTGAHKRAHARTQDRQD